MTLKAASILILKVLFVFPFKLIIGIVKLFKRREPVRKYEVFTPIVEPLPIEEYEDEYEDEMPEFCQIFEIGNGIILGLEYLDMTPELVAAVRLVSDTAVSKRYFRKVYTDKTFTRDKYFKMNNTKYYIKDDLVIKSME